MNSRPLKILTVYYKEKPGGFCKRIRLKIEAYLDRGWEVHYIAVEPFPYTHENLVPHILPTPMKRHDTLLFWSWFFLTVPFYILQTARGIKADLLTSVSPVYACLAGPAKWLLKIPMLTLILVKPANNTLWGKGQGFFLPVEYVMEKIGLMFSDVAYANSWGSGEAWKKTYGKAGRKIGVLPNNVEDPPFDKQKQRERLLAEFSLADNSFVITNSGILEKRKNQACLIRALAEVKHPHAVLLILGEGGERDALQALADKLGVADRTILPGWRNDALALVQGSDAFVFPSFREGMAESLLEGTTCRVPCLVSDIPENTDVVRNPEQHFPPDRPEILAEKIQRLIDDREYYDKLLETTLEDKERFVFDWGGEIVQRTEELLKRSPQRE